MGFMQRFERSLESSTGNVFARMFGGELTSLEVENALRREASEQLQQLPDGQLLAPNHFRVILSPPDAARFATNEATSPRVVSRHLDTYLYDQDWGVVGDVIVEFESSKDLHTGQYRLTSECNDAVDASMLPKVEPPKRTTSSSNIHGSSQRDDEEGPGAEPYTAAFLLDKETGTRLFVLNPGGNLVGRGDDVDFRVPDTGVSRHHARVDWNGVVATITDLNSTNGTFVNGIRISQWQLAKGDEIVMGHTRLVLGTQ